MRLIKQDTNIWPFPCGYDLALAHTLYCKRFVRFRVLFKTHISHDVVGEEGAEKKEPYSIYFLCKCWTHNKLVLRNFHPSLIISARIVMVIFRRPRTPWFRGRQIESQDLRLRLRDFSGGNPHKKSLKRRSRVLHREDGKRKVLVA